MCIRDSYWTNIRHREEMWAMNANFSSFIFSAQIFRGEGQSQIGGTPHAGNGSNIEKRDNAGNRDTGGKTATSSGEAPTGGSHRALGGH
eukprot:13282290-Heterocapsa_arctica.AAC.1